MWENLHNGIAPAFALGGGLVVLLAMIGFVRMPDVYCRSHALGVGMTLGFGLLVVGLWWRLGDDAGGLKLLAAIVFQFATIPVSTHLLMLQARRDRTGKLGDEGGEAMREEVLDDPASKR